MNHLLIAILISQFWGFGLLYKYYQAPVVHKIHYNLLAENESQFSFVISPTHFVRYFTYRARKDYQEDRIYRHLEPALAFQVRQQRQHAKQKTSISINKCLCQFYIIAIFDQLELNRLKNYDLQSCPTSRWHQTYFLCFCKIKIG